jgi:hypothetical protein
MAAFVSARQATVCEAGLSHVVSYSSWPHRIHEGLNPEIIPIPGVTVYVSPLGDLIETFCVQHHQFADYNSSCTYVGLNSANAASSMAGASFKTDGGGKSKTGEGNFEAASNKLNTVYAIARWQELTQVYHVQ